jgi:hypothetical protein
MSRYWFGDISPEMEATEERFNVLMTKNPNPDHTCKGELWNDIDTMLEEWHKTREDLLFTEKYNDQYNFQKLLYYRWDLNCRLDMYEEVMDEEHPDYDKHVWEIIGMIKAGRIFHAPNYVHFQKAFELCKDQL